MTHNVISSTAPAGDKYSSAEAPVWTVPTVSATSDSNLLIAADNKQLPDYNTLNSPSAPEIGDLPPNYFDISIVPNGAVLHYNEVVPHTEPSKAEVERDNTGVLSLDPLIDSNPDQLWLYFMTYLNEIPRLSANIHGYHTEYYTAIEHYRDPHGHCQTRHVNRSRQVTDFNFSIDLTTYVSRQWWRVAVIPSKKTIDAGEVISLRAALEQYTLSQKSIKEIVCQKQLCGWNFQELRDKIMGLLYSSGYRHHISVKFSVYDDRIAARSSSKMSRFANSTWTRVLCVISCLFLIFGPIYLCLRASGNTRDRIIAEYPMVAPIDTFLQFNCGMIVNAALSGSGDLYVAYIA